MRDFTNATHAEVAAAVCAALQEKHINATMSGGGCVTIYSDNKYLSKDLDFVDSSRLPRTEILEALKPLGFTLNDRYFRHPTTEIYLEFPPGPLTAGDTILTPFEFVSEHGPIRMLSPTDSVKDRLAAWFHWNNSGQSLYQALLVVVSQPTVNLREIRRWSESEGCAEHYRFFAKLLDAVLSNGLNEDEISQKATMFKLKQRKR